MLTNMMPVPGIELGLATGCHCENITKFARSWIRTLASELSTLPIQMCKNFFISLIVHRYGCPVYSIKQF
jgi:hypothetical protein